MRSGNIYLHQNCIKTHVRKSKLEYYVYLKMNVQKRLGLTISASSQVQARLENQPSQIPAQSTHHNMDHGRDVKYPSTFTLSKETNT